MKCNCEICACRMFLFNFCVQDFTETQQCGRDQGSVPKPKDASSDTLQTSQQPVLLSLYSVRVQR